MEKIKNNLLYSAIACFIFGILTLGIPIFSIIQLSLGAYILYIRNQNPQNICNNKKKISILAIILLIFNLVASVFLFITIDYLDAMLKGHRQTAPPNNNINYELINKNITTKPVKEKPKVDPEIKRIDITLKLGVAMVATSGLLFATSRWDLITDPIKVIALIIMGLIFLGTSKISEKILKIETTTFTYWLLAMLFFIFAMISIGALGIFGEWLTYSGDGKNLMYALTYLLIATLSYITNHKKKHNIFLYITYLSTFITLYNILRFITLSRLISISIITVIMLIINITQKKNYPTLHKFTMATSYLVAWTPIFISQESFIENLIACTLNIININYLTFDKNHQDEPLTITSAIFTYILLTKLVAFLEMETYAGPIAIIIYTIFSIGLNYIKINSHKTYKIANKILYYIFTGYYLLYSILENQKAALIASIIIMVANIVNDYLDKHEKIDIYVQPVIIFALVSSLGNYINTNVAEIKMVSTLAISSLIYTIINYFSKEKSRKDVYYYCSYIGMIGTILIAVSNAEKLSALIAIAGFTYHYLISKDKNIKIVSYIALLISINLTMVNVELLPLPTAYNALITLWIYVLIKFFQKEEHVIESISSIAIVIPAYTIINNLTLIYEIQRILETTLSLYVLYLFVKLFIKDPKNKNLIFIIGLAILLLSILEANIIIGLYIGIVGIIVMMYGFYQKEQKDFFTTGIAIVVINIVYQLKDLWEQIHFSLYLLAAGLGLIIFVTYKEIKKNNSKNPQPKQEENNTNPEKFHIQSIDEETNKDELPSKEMVEKTENTNSNAEKQESVREEVQ